jgi:CheY-like chemotaxis protein
VADAAVSGHVLIVEDNALVASAMRILLEHAGHTVTQAGSVAGAVHAMQVATHTPDVALLDLTLPDGDGLGVLDRLRAIGREPRVAIAVTGRDDPHERTRCLSAGCRDVLLKPVPARELAKLVASWLGVRDET